MVIRKEPVPEAEPLDVRAAPVLAGRHPETIRRWIWSGRLSGQRRGRRVLVSRADVVSLVGQASIGTSLAEWARSVRTKRGLRVLFVDTSVVADWVAPDVGTNAPASALLRRLHS